MGRPWLRPPGMPRRLGWDCGAWRTYCLCGGWITVDGWGIADMKGERST